MNNKVLLLLVVTTFLLAGCTEQVIIPSSDNMPDPVFRSKMTSNNVYGELYGFETGEVNIISSNTYYAVTNLTNGDFQGLIVNDSSLTIIKAGVYHVTSQWSFSDGANNEYHLSLSINNVQNDNCHSQRKMGTTGDVGSASYTCLVNLNSGDVLRPVIENVFSNSNPSIHDFQLIILLL